MIQKCFLDEIEEIYEGDDFTSIMPVNQKKCRERFMVSTLPKPLKDKLRLKKLLKKATNIAITENLMVDPDFEDQKMDTSKKTKKSNQRKITSMFQ